MAIFCVWAGLFVSRFGFGWVREGALLRGGHLADSPPPPKMVLLSQGCLLEALAKQTCKLTQVNASLQNQNLWTDLRWVAKRICKSARKSQKAVKFASRRKWVAKRSASWTQVQNLRRLVSPFGQGFRDLTEIRQNEHFFITGVLLQLCSCLLTALHRGSDHAYRTLHGKTTILGMLSLSLTVEERGLICVMSQRTHQ